VEVRLGGQEVLSLPQAFRIALRRFDMFQGPLGVPGFERLTPQEKVRGDVLGGNLAFTPFPGMEAASPEQL
jgi:hypothetical protein